MNGAAVDAKPAEGPVIAAAEKARDTRYAAISAGTNFLSILAGVTEILFHPLVARLYGVPVYGLYRWGVSSIEPIQRLAILGCDKGLLRHVAAHRLADETELAERSLRTAFWLSAIGSLFLAAVTLLCAPTIARWQGAPESASALQLLAPSLPFYVLIVVFVSATMGAKTMRYNLFVRGITQPLVLLLLALGIGWFVRTVWSLCLAHLLAMIVTAAAALLALSKVFRITYLGHMFWPDRRQRGHRPFFHTELIRFSLPMGLAEFVNSILQRTDVILIGFYAGAETLGIYAGVEAMSRLVSSIRYAFDPVASPVLSESLRQNDLDRLRYNLQLMTRWTTLGTLPLLVFMTSFRRELLELFPNVVVAGSTALLILLGGHAVNSTLGLTGWVIAMSGRSKLALVNNLVAASCNVLCCLYLLPRYGIIGAAIASSVAVLLMQCLQACEVYGLYRVHCGSRGLGKGILAGVLALAVGSIARPFLPSFFLLRLLCGAVVVAGSYLGMLFASGLGAEERHVLRRVIAKLRSIGTSKTPQ